MSSPRFAGVILWLGACGQAPRPAPPGSTPAPPQPAVVMSAITGANVVWGDALVRGDSAVLGSLYTDDATLMTPEGDRAGRTAIVAALISGRRRGLDTVQATATATDHLEVAGDKAYEAGTLVYTMAQPRGGRREVQVRYVNFWQQAGDRWLLRRSLRPLP